MSKSERVHFDNLSRLFQITVFFIYLCVGALSLLIVCALAELLKDYYGFVFPVPGVILLFLGMTGAGMQFIDAVLEIA